MTRWMKALDYLGWAGIVVWVLGVCIDSLPLRLWGFLLALSTTLAWYTLNRRIVRRQLALCRRALDHVAYLDHNADAIGCDGALASCGTVARDALKATA